MKLLWISCLIVLTAVTALSQSSLDRCDDESYSRTAADAGNEVFAEPPMEVALDVVLDSPSRFQGERLRLTAKLSGFPGASAFTIEDDDPLFPDTLLVLTVVPTAELLGHAEKGTFVTVVGSLRVLEPAALARTYPDEPELAAAIEELPSKWISRPVLVVDRADVPLAHVWVAAQRADRTTPPRRAAPNAAARDSR